jgi:hypothetical protein
MTPILRFCNLTYSQAEKSIMQSKDLMQKNRIVVLISCN